MNKTLLLILVDFLLLTILSLTTWDEPLESSPPSGLTETPLASMSLMEQDLLDTLKSSLDEESAAQAALQEAMAAREQDLEEAREQLQQRGSLVESLQIDLQGKQSEAERLAGQVSQSKEALSKLQSDLGSMELRVRQTEAQSRLLQEELLDKEKQIEQKETALAEAEEAQATAQQEIQELNIKARVFEEERKYFSQSLENLKTEIEIERQEKQALQAQSEALTAGVTQLAAQSEDLKEEIRSNIPINANQLYSRFLENQVEARFRNYRLRGQESVALPTILVTDGDRIAALSHFERVPLSFDSRGSSARRLEATLSAGGRSAAPSSLNFLVADPRLVSVPLSEAQAQALQVEVYYTALDPFRFSEAVLVDGKGDYYGEVEFKLDARTKGYVKMQSKIFSRLFGEFSPSTGDLVFSKTGELLGIMVDRSYCALIGALLPAESLPLDENLEDKLLKEVSASLKSRYENLSSSVR